MKNSRSRKTASKTRIPRALEKAAASDTGSDTGQQNALALHRLRETPLPSSSRAIFWSPRYLAASSILVHLPFLFWLVETIRPASVVQLGLRDGVGFMGLCQAVDKLGLEAVCVGLELPDNGTDKLPEKLRETHASLYSDFSFILAEEAGRAARQMSTAQVDLLVIDTSLDETLLTSLQAHWTPLLSERAVVVLIAPEQTLTTEEARSFHKTLFQAHATVSFPQITPGLDVILLGKEQPERLRQLAQLDLASPGYLHARNVFMRLGQGIENSQQTRSKSFALEKAKASLKEMEGRFSDLERQCKEMQSQVAAAQDAEDAQVSANGKLQAEIFDLTQALEAARARSATHDDLEALRETLHARDAELKELQGALNQEKSKRKQNRAQLDEATAEITALTARLAQAEDQLKARSERLAAREKDWAQAQADAKSARSASEQLMLEFRDKLKQSQEKRLALWEAHEALKLQYQALLRASGERPVTTATTPGTDEGTRK